MGRFGESFAPETSCGTFMSQPDPTHNPPLDQVELTDGGSQPTATGMGTVSFAPGSDEVAPSSSATGTTEAKATSTTRYEVQKHLGTGSFGSVSLAWDHQLQREVAIKRPRSGLPSAVLQSFLREAQLVARLRHPSVVVVHDVQVTDAGEPFIVYEYLPGQSLRQRLRANERLPLAVALSIAFAIAEGLAAAHKLGLTHRDLKPANVLFDAEGRPHIADFGLAVQEGQQQLLKGEVAGTYKYMAPEQVRGEAHQLDGRTDLWALGVMLYEMLTGHQPFTGDKPADIADQILNREPRPPRQWVPEIPKELERLVLKLLAKRVGERIGSASEVAYAIKNLTNTRPSSEPLAQRITKSFLAVVLIAGFLIVGSGVYVGLMFNTSQKQAVLGDVNFPVGGWVQLMELSPPPVIELDDTSVVIHEPYRLHVESQYPELLLLGSTSARRYSYRVRISLDRSDDQAGLFIGLGTQRTGTDKDTVTLLKIVKVDDKRIAVEPGAATMDASGAQTYSFFRQQSRSSSVPFASEVTLQVDVNDAVISRVLLNDHEVSLELPQLRELRTSGQFGLLNHSGHHTFSNPVFRRR